MASQCLRWNPLQLRPRRAVPQSCAACGHVRVAAGQFQLLVCVPAKAPFALHQASRARDVSSAAYNSYDLNSSVQTFSQLLSLAIVAVGAYLLSKQDVEDDTFSGDRCPRCNGTGKEACFCNKWSDGDVGCSSCNYTGYTVCKSCGGGGNAVPIPLAIRKDEGMRNQYDRR